LELNSMIEEEKKKVEQKDQAISELNQSVS
jgi:hypothetical protein